MVRPEEEDPVSNRINVLAAGVVAFAGLVSTASADFSGPYAPGNWDFITNGGSGALDLSGVPSEITVIGDDSGLDNTYTQLQIKVPFDGDFKFNWLYSSTDSGTFDNGGYLTSVDGVIFDYVELADNDTQGSGVVDLKGVKAGTIFGFYVFSVDGVFGAGNLTISQFSGPVPAPSALGLLGVAGLAATRRRR
jgi:MYXO-CTERM domain-containing protein